MVQIREHRRSPTVEEMGDLFVKTLHEMDKAHTQARHKVEYPECYGINVTRLEILAAFRKVYSNALAAGCELIGASEEDWECIFDVDRPKKEWNLLNHLDLLGIEGAD